MKYKILIGVIFIFLFITSMVSGISREGHKFSQSDCIRCHTDEKLTPLSMKPTIDFECISCHSDLETQKSHPVNVYPSMNIPADLPLVDGRLSCITCHFVHPENSIGFITDNNLLRRQTKGVLFCTTCHRVDSKGHIILGNIHPGSYQETDGSTRLDPLTLQCIECHDTYLRVPVSSLGAGRWYHYNKRANHPIGVSYVDISREKRNEFRPVSMLRKEIRLFDGKIGCGTCHSIYSKEPYMLVIDNEGSRLCLECHNK